MANSSFTNSEQCHMLKTNSTESIRGWEGIPEASVLNALCATVSLIIFAVLRIIYFKQKPTHNDWNIGWLQFIFNDRSVTLLHSETDINRQHPNAYLPVYLHEYSRLIGNKLPETHPNSSLYVISSMAERMKQKHQAKLDSVGQNRCWLLDYLLIRDKDIYEHRGNDAFQYLLFQRYIIYFLTALTAVCMFILMPINIFGKFEDVPNFKMTTINNIKESSNIFWIHAFISIAIVILGLLMMKSFSDLIFTPVNESDDRTILIQNVPESKRSARLLKKFIEQKFLGVEVVQIWFTYDIDMLSQLKKQQETIESALIYTEKYRQTYGYPLQISPQSCGRISSFCSTVDAATYYTAKSAEYRGLIEEEVHRLLTEPKHAVFLQLKNELMAQRVLEHFNSTHHERILKQAWKSIKSCFGSFREERPNDVDSFCYHSWIVRAAPFPDDIEWEDIIMDTNRSGICALLLNCLVALIFIFLTTPLVAVNFLDDYLGLKGKIDEVTIGSSKIQLAKYFGVLIFNLFSMILPNLVLMIILNTPRNTKSEKSYRAMLYLYLFLVLMVLIFPTIGLNSGQLLLTKLFDSRVEDHMGIPKKMYKCLFQPGSSAWFVMMILSSIFVNNSLELLRLPELCLYLLNCLLYPRTEAEYLKARKKTDFEFSYGSNYPRFLLIFTIVTTYSFSCPIIAPFGLLYMLLKHLVDRYSIYYLYSVPVISPNIHQMAITFVLTSFFFMLFQLTAFLNTRIEFSVSFKPPNICTVACLLYLILLFFVCCNFSSLYAKESTAVTRLQTVVLENQNQKQKQTRDSQPKGNSNQYARYTKAKA